MARLNIIGNSFISIWGEYSYTQDINNNTTTLYTKVKLWCAGGGGGYLNVSGGVQIGGSYHNGSGVSVNLSTGGTYEIYSRSDVLSHNGDGSFPSGIGLQFSETSDEMTEYSNHIYLDTVIPSIPRASSIVASPNSIEFGGEVSFSITRASTNYVHDITYNANGISGTIGSDVVASVDWTIPMSLINRYPNITNGQCRIDVVCTTKDIWGNMIGQTVCTVTAIIPSSVKPTATLTTEDVGTVPDAWNIWLKEKSKLKVTISAQGAYGSTISTYSSTANGETFNYTPFTTKNLNYAGAMQIRSVIKDSRNRSVTKTKNITVIDYFAPTISSFIVKRCDADGTLNETGVYAKATITYAIAPCSNKNTKSLTVTQGQVTKTITLTEYNGTVETGIFENISVTENFLFECALTDYFASKTLTETLKTAKKALSIHHSRNGVTIGRIATESGFHVAMESSFEDDVTIEHGANLQFEDSNGDSHPLFPIGFVYISIYDQNPGEIFGGTWTKITGNRFLRCVSSNAGATGGSTTSGSTSLSVAQLPKHTPKTVNGNTIAAAKYRYESGTSANGYFVVNNNDGYPIEEIAEIGNGNGHTHSVNPLRFDVYAWYRTA